MQVYALQNRAGYVVVNALMVERPHDSSLRPAQVADCSRYIGDRGVIVQCAHCRLVQQAASPMRWDWVPEWVEAAPAGTSHGLCHVCFDYFYPAIAA
jgi:hypothetical protein